MRLRIKEAIAHNDLRAPPIALRLPCSALRLPCSREQVLLSLPWVDSSGKGPSWREGSLGRFLNIIIGEDSSKLLDNGIKQNF